MVMELLAPAGSYDVFKIAVNLGSDAVYLAGQNFGARAYAENFTTEEIKKSVEYAHLNNTKVFITVNTLLNNLEIVDFLKYIFKLYKIGVDAVIVQDFGALKLIRSIFPEMTIHASTQMSLNNYYSVLWAAENGFSRVIFPRELSIDEISKINSKLKENNKKIELEVFSHGALCYSISGNCYISSLNNGRSGNRGACTQPCRREYILKYKGHKVSDGYLLSTHDLNLSDDLDKLAKSGIDSIKLEGRMKSEDYVGTIVNSYRNLLDKKEGSFKDDLNFVFNRKFTKGYIMNQNPSEVMGRETSGHIGYYIGKITAINKEYPEIIENNQIISNNKRDIANNGDVNNYDVNNCDVNNSDVINNNINKSDIVNNSEVFNNSINKSNIVNNNTNNSNKAKNAKNTNSTNNNKNTNNNKKNNKNTNKNTKNNKNTNNTNNNSYNKKNKYFESSEERIRTIKEIKVSKENPINIEQGDGIAFKYGKKVKGIYIDDIIRQNDEYIVFNTTRNIRVGDEVYISYSRSINKELKKYKKEFIQSKIPISLNISLDKELYGKIEAKFNIYNETIKFNYKSSSKFEKAINRPITKEEIKKQLFKTGNTPFFMNNITINDFPANLFIPTSKLNKIRREILDKASIKLLNYYKKDKTQIKDAKSRLNRFIKNYKSKNIKNNNLKNKNSPKFKNNLELSVFVDNLELVETVSNYNVKKIYFDPSYLFKSSKDYFENIKKILTNALAKITTQELVWVLPSFISDDEIEKCVKVFNKLESEKIPISIMSDIPGISGLFNSNMYGNHNLNVWNNFSCEELSDAGFNSLILSPELSYDEMKSLISKYVKKDIDIEIIAHGNLEVIVSNDDFSNLKNNKSLNMKKQEYAILEDKKRKKFKYKVISDFNKKSHIINKDCLCLIDEIDKIEKIGIDSIILDCRFSNDNYTSNIISLYQEGLKDTSKKNLDSLKKQIYSLSHSYLSKGNFLDGRIHEKDLKFKV